MADKYSCAGDVLAMHSHYPDRREELSSHALIVKMTTGRKYLLQIQAENRIAPAHACADRENQLQCR